MKANRRSDPRPRFRKHVLGLRLSATPSDHAFRPRLSHAFQPRLSATLSGHVFRRAIRFEDIVCTPKRLKTFHSLLFIFEALAQNMGKSSGIHGTSLCGFDTLVQGLDAVKHHARRILFLSSNLHSKARQAGDFHTDSHGRWCRRRQLHGLQARLTIGPAQTRTKQARLLPPRHVQQETSVHTQLPSGDPPENRNIPPSSPHTCCKQATLQTRLAREGHLFHCPRATLHQGDLPDDEQEHRGEQVHTIISAYTPLHRFRSTREIRTKW